MSDYTPTFKIPLFIKKRFFENFIFRPSNVHQKSIDLRPKDIYKSRINPIRRNYSFYTHTPYYKASIRVISNI